jgi:hypothetical protein
MTLVLRRTGPDDLDVIHDGEIVGRMKAALLRAHPPFERPKAARLKHFLLASRLSLALGFGYGRLSSSHQPH